MEKRLRTIIVAFGLVATLAIQRGEVVSAATTETRSPRSASPSKSANSEIASLLERINALRRSHGIALLILDPRLCAIAERHGRDMVARNYFAHDTPEGVSPFGRMSREHYHFGYAGENLAIDRDLNTAENALVASPEHFENIVEPHFIRIGISTITARDGELVIEDFSD